MATKVAASSPQPWSPEPGALPREPPGKAVPPPGSGSRAHPAWEQPRFGSPSPAEPCGAAALVLLGEEGSPQAAACWALRWERSPGPAVLAVMSSRGREPSPGLADGSHPLPGCPDLRRPQAPSWPCDPEDPDPSRPTEESTLLRNLSARQAGASSRSRLLEVPTCSLLCPAAPGAGCRSPLPRTVPATTWGSLCASHLAESARSCICRVAADLPLAPVGFARVQDDVTAPQRAPGPERRSSPAPAPAWTPIFGSVFEPVT